MCLASFTQYNVLKVYQCCSMSQYFIPFFGQIIFHHWIYHILLIHLLMNLWVGSTFWLLWIVSVVMNIYVHVFVWTSISNLWGLCLGVVLQDHMVTLWLTCSETTKPFSQWLYHCMFPTAMCKRSIISASFATPNFLLLLFSK